MAGRAKRIGRACADVGDVVSVLVPDVAGVDPVVEGVTKDPQPSHGAVVRTKDDLGATIVVDVYDHGIFERGGRAIGGGIKNTACRAVENAHIDFVVVDDFGLAIAFKVKDRRACLGGRVVLGFEGPQQREFFVGDIDGINDVVVTPSRSDIGVFITVKVGDCRRTTATARDGDTGDQCACLAMMNADGSSANDHDFGLSVFVKVCDRRISVRSTVAPHRAAIFTKSP